MKRIFKKGFTLVELVIVIAVIAVLAAVLIPTFSDIIEKANNSADLQEARNLFSEALIEDPTITDGTVYVQVGEVEDNKYVIFTDGAPVDNNKDGNYTNEKSDDVVLEVYKTKEGKELSKIYKDINDINNNPIDPDDPVEHVHSLTNGVCECGAKHYICNNAECEKGVNKYLTDEEYEILKINATDYFGCPDCFNNDNMTGGLINACQPGCTICGKTSNPEVDEPADPEHTHNYSYTNNGDGTHVKSCTICNDTDLNTVEDHKYEHGICSCRDKKTYTYKCNSCNTEKTGCTKTYDKINKEYIIKDSNGNTLSKCGKEKHYLHLDCKEILPHNEECEGCLVEVVECEHTNSIVTKENVASSNYHERVCDDCNETFLEAHKVVNSNCACGHHVCVPTTPVDLGNGSHQVGCHYCDKISEINHSAGGASYYTKDAYGHTGTCGSSEKVHGCGVVFTSEHNFYNNTCATCQYVKCTHIDINNLPSSDYSGWTITPSTHKLICDECGNNKLIIKESAHNTEGANGECTVCGYKEGMACAHTNIQNNICQGCNKFIVINSNTWTNIPWSANTDVLLVLSPEVTSLTVSSAITVKANICIDLNGKKLIMNNSITVSTGSLTILNGSLEINKNISVNGNILNIENVEITQSSTDTSISAPKALLMGASNATIEITNCTINVDNTYNKRVIYFHANNINNVKINITDSKFTNTGNSLLFFYSQTQSYMINNIININGVSKFNENTIDTTNILNYINDYGKNITIK